MKNSILHIAAAFALFLIPVACTFRPLYIEGETPVKVLVITDWAQLGSLPSGASINFYPETGKTFWPFRTNSVSKAIVSVPSGYHNVMVFNRTTDEFGSMSFDGMDKLGTSRAILESKLFPWVGRADSIGRTVYEPEELVVGRTDHFLVRSQIEREAELWEQGKEIPDRDELVDSVEVYPRRVPYVGYVNVRVNGIHNIRSVRAYLTGMAGDAYLSTRTAGDSLATHVLENWKLVRDEADYTKGLVTATFSCFGLPDRYKGNLHEKNNKLVMQFMLVDNRTVIQEIRYVGDVADQNEDERTVTFNAAVDLPDVKPEGGSESGFDVTITDWEDPIEVPIGI